MHHLIGFPQPVETIHAYALSLEIGPLSVKTSCPSIADKVHWSCYVKSLIPVDHLLASGQSLHGIIYFSLPFQSIYGVLSSLFFTSCPVHLHPFSASLTFCMSPVFLNCHMCRRYSTARSG